MELLVRLTNPVFTRAVEAIIYYITSVAIKHYILTHPHMMIRSKKNDKLHKTTKKP